MSWRDSIKKDDSSWRDTIQPETSPVLDTISDIAPSFAQGITWGGSDELYGLGKAAIEAPTSEEDFSTLLNKYVREGRERTKLAEERSPVTSTVSEITGSVATPFLGGLGTGSKTVGATRSLLNRLGMTLPEWKQVGALGKAGLAAGQVAGAAAEGGIVGAVGGFGKAQGDLDTKMAGAEEGAKTGATFGAAMGTLPIAGKMLSGADELASGYQKTEPSAEKNILRKLSKSYSMGKAGESLNERSVIKELSDEADLVAKNVQDARSNVGKGINTAVSNATTQGITIPTSKVASIITEELSETPLNQKLTNLLLDESGNIPDSINPAKLNQIREFIGKKSLDPNYGYMARQAYGKIGKLMEDVPELKKAVGEFREVSQKIGDPLINELETFDNLKNKLSDYGADKNSMISAIRDGYRKALEYSTHEGTRASDLRYNSKLYFDKLKEFRDSNPELYKKTDLPSPEEMYAKFVDISDKSGILQGVWRSTTEGAKVLNYLTSTILNPYEYARGAGKVVGGAEKGISGLKSFFGMSNADKVAKIQKIKANPSYTSNPSMMKDLERLEANIQSGNRSLQNAILFKMLQTKEGRDALETQEDESNPQ